MSHDTGDAEDVAGEDPSAQPMVVARSEELICRAARLNDYLQVVRSEVQMADLAGEAPQHAAAYPTMPPPPRRHDGGRLSSVFSDNGKSGKGGKGAKGKVKDKHGRIGKGGKGQSKPSGHIMMCFRCTRLGHSR